MFGRYLPVISGSIFATVLFVLFVFNLLGEWSANTDHPLMGYDYYGLPRSALAIRFGTNPFTSHLDYPYYGPWATAWVTFPTLSILAAPLSYLPPKISFWVFNSLNFILHLTIIILFGRRFCRQRLGQSTWTVQIRDCLFFGALGFFIPWYVLYYQGQYHSVAVLAVFLVLASRNRFIQLIGFSLSALGKPILVTAAPILFVRREWKVIGLILAVLLVGFVPWFIFKYDVETGLQFGRNEIMFDYLEQTSIIAKHSTYRWNQQISLSAALDEFMTPISNLQTRYVIGGLIILYSLIIRRQREAAIALSIIAFFAVYARGHEYHYTLFVPILACLYSLGPRYNSWPMVLLAILMATPTTWIVFKYVYDFSDPVSGSANLMFSTNEVFYYLFLWHKPTAAMLTAVYIAVNETRTLWGNRKRDMERSAECFDSMQ